MVNYNYRKEDVERARGAYLSQVEDDILYKLAKNHVDEIDAEIKKYWNALENFCWEEMKWVVRKEAEETKSMPDMSIDAFVNRVHILTDRYNTENGETSIPELPKAEVLKFAKQQSNFFRNNFDMRYVTGSCTSAIPDTKVERLVEDRLAIDTPTRTVEKLEKLTEEEIPF